MIIVTGAAGFIGSCMIRLLNNYEFTEILAVDDFSNKEKNKNLLNKNFQGHLERDKLFDWLETNAESVSGIIHLGARTDTVEKDWSIFQHLNIDYSKKLWQFCAKQKLPFVYASSAATYGNGDFGFNDDHQLPSKLKPLNQYGKSKNDFDTWALNQKTTPSFWAGLKFFNVYGPNEYHKGRMASVIYHTFHQVNKTGKMNLFRSHKEEYENGEQFRDFIYVKDVVEVCWHMFSSQPSNGLYNIGTGKARSFNDLAKNTFISLGKEVYIDYIDIPEDIREFYQYYTEAKVNKLLKTDYPNPFYTLEEGIYDYVSNYLKDTRYW